jgi:Amt family ammonium transporter
MADGELVSDPATAVEACTPVFISLDCSGLVNDTGSFCEGYPPSVGAAADLAPILMDKGLDEITANGIATQACRSAELASGVNTNFLLVSAYLVFLMQAGFAMLCAGSVRSKNTMNILLKNVLDACVGAVAFYLLGYGFAYQGDQGEGNTFIGTSNFALHQFTPVAGLDSSDTTNVANWAGFLFQWAFAAAAATIVSGSVAERTGFLAYLFYSVFLTSFVYPVVVHWAWDSYGWLSAFNSNPLLGVGMIDFAGSGVVHMVGGFAGLWGAAIVGPRVGRFDADGQAIDMPGHSATLVVLGTFLLWFGWYGFNPGSYLSIASAVAAEVVGRTAVTTTLSGGTAGAVSLLLNYYLSGAWNLIDVCNGILAGLVSITAGCSVVEPWAAMIAGGVGAFVFTGACKLLFKVKVDDPLQACPMHGFCGAWGVLYVGFMANPTYVQQAYGDVDYGVFYGGAGRLFACQIIGILCIFAWVTVMMGPFFFVLNKLGMLRVSPAEELAGLDVSKHGGHAYYPEDSPSKSPDKIAKPQRDHMLQSAPEM